MQPNAYTEARIGLLTLAWTGLKCTPNALRAPAICAHNCSLQVIADTVTKICV